MKAIGRGGSSTSNFQRQVPAEAQRKRKEKGRGGSADNRSGAKKAHGFAGGSTQWRLSWCRGKGGRREGGGDDDCERAFTRKRGVGRGGSLQLKGPFARAVRSCSWSRNQPPTNPGREQGKRRRGPGRSGRGNLKRVSGQMPGVGRKGRKKGPLCAETFKPVLAVRNCGRGGGG